MSADQIIAFIDLGTNSARLLLVKYAADGTSSTLSQQKEVIRLGEGEFETGRLQTEAMDRAIAVCSRFAEMAKANGANDIVAVATSATREASNRNVFLQRMRSEAGIELRVISGKEEARLIYLGVASGARIDQRQALFVDIGGGSTEIILGDQSEYAFIESLKLGAIRLTARFFKPGFDAPVSDGDYRKLTNHIRAQMLRSVQALSRRSIDMVIGSSGTIQNLTDITARRVLGRSPERDEEIATSDIRETVHILRSMPLAQRRKVPGLNPDRADIIVAGAAIIETLLNDLKLKGLRTSDRGLRDGMLIDLQARRTPQVTLTSTSFRERSVLRLGRRCNFDEPHAFHVARLAIMLFDSARENRLHELDASYRELLEFAALLHDVGIFVAYARHQNHSHYLIRHAELLGFDNREIELIALMARYHHKSYPSKRHSEFAALDDAHKQALRVLAHLLRLAESLDRSHTGVVRSAGFESKDNGCGEVTLRLDGAGDCHLEAWAALDCAKVFRRTFGSRLAVRISGQTSSLERDR